MLKSKYKGIFLWDRFGKRRQIPDQDIADYDRVEQRKQDYQRVLDIVHKKQDADSQEHEALPPLIIKNSMDTKPAGIVELASADTSIDTVEQKRRPHFTWQHCSDDSLMLSVNLDGKVGKHHCHFKVFDRNFWPAM
jgi:hypothetical protein